MALDIVIPFVQTSIWDNNELKYCVKSIKINSNEDVDIYIVGEKIKISNTRNIIVNERYESKSKDIAYKIYKYCKQNQGKDFLLFNDDYIVTKKHNLSISPTIVQEELIQTFLKSNSKFYKEYITNTIRLLECINRKTFNYDIHKPMIINTYMFIELYERFYRGDNKYLVKSLYGNYYSIPFQIGKDAKIRSNKISQEEFDKIINDNLVISISDNALIHGYKEKCKIKEYLKEKFN